MKTAFVRQVRALRERRRQEKGVALVTVLAIVMLMTVLVTSFFLMSTSELNASVKDADNLKVRALADAAVNIVIGQIRQATAPRNGSTITPWASQPGAIRTFTADGSLNQIYKLYSAASPIANTSAAVESDVQADWNVHPDQFVDMNDPIVVPDLDDPENINLTELYFPIVDPRAYRSISGGASGDRASVEGFSYEKGVNGVVLPGTSTNQQRLPMPVRWVYVLSDGSLGVFNTAGGWQGSGDTKPSKENPIVARLAYWTDDETCKINVNTASEGVFWDTPHVSTPQDAMLGNNMPVNGEFQRYPGHPAGVCMSSVLFPRKRWKPTDQADRNDRMDELSRQEIQSIWQMAPFINGVDDGRSSFGGTMIASTLAVKASASPNDIQRNRLTPYPNPKHLYASFDDYVIASTADAGRTVSDKKIGERTTSDKGGGAGMVIPADRLKEGRFFLTSRNSAPETTLSGTPRVALWPMHVDCFEALKKGNVGSATATYTVFDSLIAFNSTLQEGGKPAHAYFVTRSDPNSRHTEWYGRGAASGRVFPSRDEELYRYLLALAYRPIPGFTYANRTGISYSTFTGKYGQSDTDETASILAQMFDFIRNQNLYDGNLEVSKRYVGADPRSYGQVTPFCLCGGADEHANNWFDQTASKPKGIGRMITVSEVGLWIKLNGEYRNGAWSPAGYTPYNTNAATALGMPIPTPIPQGSVYREYQASILVEGFAPAHGWGEYRPRCAVQITSGTGAGETPLALGGRGLQVGIPATINNVPLLFETTGEGMIEATPTDNSFENTPRQWIGWGGSVGPRIWGSLISFRPWAEGQPGGAGAGGGGGGSADDGGGGGGGASGLSTSLGFSGTSDASGSKTGWRLIIYDTTGPGNGTAAAGTVDTSNLIQCIPIGFPGFIYSTPKKPRGRNDYMLKRARQNLEPMFDKDEIVQSLVTTHGDYRLTAGRRMMLPQVKGRDVPLFVAHPYYGDPRRPQAHSFREPMPDYAAVSKMASQQPLSAFAKQGYFDQATGIELEPEMQPDFPICPYDTQTQIKYLPLIYPGNGGFGNVGWGNVKTMTAEQIFGFENLGTANKRIRNSFKPGETGDFETGIGPAPDGPYSRRGDEGNVMGIQRRGPGVANYFAYLRAEDSNTAEPFTSSAAFSPNRMIASSGAFGGVATGVADMVPWNTLLFRPDLYPTGNVGTQHQKPFHYGAVGPSDHLMMDWFWMPVVEPYSISEPFATAGKINMNYRIAPFSYIKRATALHALFKGEMITAIPNRESKTYKLGQSTTPGQIYPVQSGGSRQQYRHSIDAETTLQQWENRFDGTSPSYINRNKPPGAFISASEICDQWLVPVGLSVGKSANAFNSTLEKYWDQHRLTGENLREKPYANLYPRLTTRSNTYRVHVIAQTLRKAKTSDPEKWDSEKDSVTSEYRGSYLVERSIDPTDPGLVDYASRIGERPNATITPLDAFYTFRISQVKQFVR